MIFNRGRWSNRGPANTSPILVNKKQSIQCSDSDPLKLRIITAARSRFKRFGYAKTSMQEIAADCRMSAANLYRYYEGKLAIGSAVVIEVQMDAIAIESVADFLAQRARCAPQFPP